LAEIRSAADLSGTSLGNVDVDLADPSGAPDGAADDVVVFGTEGNVDLGDQPTPSDE
jgi:hypothetical protein